MIYDKKLEFYGENLSIETGEMARQADGSCVVKYGKTMVLATAVADNEQSSMGFFPLMVDYREKAYSAGKIPGGFFKREGKSSDKEILASRMIDRPIRPLFADDFFNEVQIITTVVSSDKENKADVLGMLGASLSLMLSGVPFKGPIAGVRVGYVNGEYIINPTNTDLDESEMDMIVAGSSSAVTMVEGFFEKVSEEVVLQGINKAHEAIKKLCKLQKEIIDEVGQKEFDYEPFVIEDSLKEEIEEISGKKLEKSCDIKDKLKRQMYVDEIYNEVEEKILEKNPEIDQRKIKFAFKDIEKKIVRNRVVNQNKRVDGRDFDEIRPLSIRAGLLPRAHGSSLFTRGETQALVAVTLGTSSDVQILDQLKGESEKTFMLHYNFPPYCVNEVKPLRGPARREIGHGMLAEHALKPIIPEEDEFGYTVRIVSDILESNGSSSMATVCGGSLALMDAGVPVDDQIAGVAMGMIKKDDNDFIILSDITGLEDHLGDMDFKIAGTEENVTAVQMDIKIEGVSNEILKKALKQAKKGRSHILSHMNNVISEPKTDVSEFAPQMIKMQIPKDKIFEVIGPSGKTIKALTEKTNSEIWIDDDGTVKISSENREDAEQAKKEIEAIIKEYEVGDIIDGVVDKVTEYGVFVKLPNNKSALLHISEISNKYIEDVSDVFDVGDKVRAKIIKKDDKDRLSLSMKELE
ncbi:MAG: polyribonucleotide nucleotidyltransferase [Candidatus Mcinerneyibacterium aminivorans]|uniref:Polyribonucleotide nucleotidyltransferase n=1 Tax=Candidatus Mcinerneyibacterium aminivorans TaxID=2703815 RepID=A0A5D0ME94_9BACT|nr:MAG: polyribonucleotide nucleotidyltransferase [Candidatus Mcinerneyibacterium aminivorans]